MKEHIGAHGSPSKDLVHASSNRHNDNNNKDVGVLTSSPSNSTVSSLDHTHKKRAIGEIFDMVMLRDIRRIFSENDSGDDSLNEEQFREVMSHYLTAAEIDEIYPKIDINDDGNIEWHEFTSFLIAAEGNSQLASLTSSYRLIFSKEQVFTRGVFGGIGGAGGTGTTGSGGGNNYGSNTSANAGNVNIHANSTSIHHTDMISHVCITNKPYPLVITGGRDGQILCWRQSDLSFVRRIHHESKSAELIRLTNKSMNTAQKSIVNYRVAKRQAAQAGDHKIEGDGGSSRHKGGMAISCLCILTNSGHLCVGSSDNCVTMYDLQSGDLVGRYTKLQDIPTSIETFYLALKQPESESKGEESGNSVGGIGGGPTSPTHGHVGSVAGGDHHAAMGGTSDHSSSPSSSSSEDALNPLILIGDAQGSVTLIRLHNEFGMSADAGVTRKRNITLFEEAMASSITINTHFDWVMKLLYVEEVGQLLTCSLDGSICFIDMTKFSSGVTRTFYGHCSTAVQAAYDGSNDNAGGNASALSSRAVTAKSNSRTSRGVAGLNSSSVLTAGGDTASGLGTSSSFYQKKQKAMQSSDNNSIPTMCFSKLGKYIASGGGRTLLIWDPFTLKVISTMDQFTAPVCVIDIQDSLEILFVATADKFIHVYHNITFELLQTIEDPTSYRPLNTISCMVYVGGEGRRLLTMGDKITTWTLERGTEIENIREDDDICLALFNTLFQQVVTVYKSGVVTVNFVEDNSIVTVFDVSTTARPGATPGASSAKNSATSKGAGGTAGGGGGKGTEHNEEDNYSDAGADAGNRHGHGNNRNNNRRSSSSSTRAGGGANDGAIDDDNDDEALQIEPFVTHCCFDKLQRRLVVTTREQTIQLWNFNNGECLQIVEPQLPTMKFNIPLGNIRISALSCDDAFLGVRKAVRKFMFYGSTNGFAIGSQDVDGDFQEEPNFVLIEKERTKFKSIGDDGGSIGVTGGVKDVGARGTAAAGGAGHSNIDDLQQQQSVISSEASFSSASGSISLYSSNSHTTCTATDATAASLGYGALSDSLRLNAKAPVAPTAVFSAPFHNSFDTLKGHSSLSNAIVDNNAAENNNKAVLWLSCEADDKLFVAHANGSLVMWDLDKIEKYVHVDITVNEVVLDCMTRMSNKGASRTGISTVMRLLSRKTTMNKPSATGGASGTNAHNASSAVLNVTQGLGHTHAHGHTQHPPEGPAVPGVPVRRPSLSMKNGHKFLIEEPKVPVVPEFKYEDTDSSHSSDTSGESDPDDDKNHDDNNSTGSFSDNKGGNEDGEISRDQMYRNMFTHGVVSQQDRNTVLISPFHTIANAVKLKRLLHMKNHNHNRNITTGGTNAAANSNISRPGTNIITSANGVNSRTRTSTNTNTHYGDMLPDLTSTAQPQVNSPRARMLSMAVTPGRAYGYGVEYGATGSTAVVDSPSPPRGRGDGRGSRSTSPTLNNYRGFTASNTNTNTHTNTGVGSAAIPGGYGHGHGNSNGFYTGVIGEDSAVFSTAEGDAGGYSYDYGGVATADYQQQQGHHKFNQQSSSLGFGQSQTGGGGGGRGQILVPRLGPRDSNKSSSRFTHANRRLITHNVLIDHHSGDSAVGDNDNAEEEDGDCRDDEADACVAPGLGECDDNFAQGFAAAIDNDANNARDRGRSKQRASILDKTRAIVVVPRSATLAAADKPVDISNNNDEVDGGRSLVTVGSLQENFTGGVGVNGTADRKQAHDDHQQQQRMLQVLEPPKTKEITVVTCSVMLKTQISVLVGACSDKYFRFWSVPSTHTLCSCRYTDTGVVAGAGTAAVGGGAASTVGNAVGTASTADGAIPAAVVTEEAELCTSMAVNATEDLLIAGFDNGRIRIWKIILQSLITLHNNHLQAQVSAAAAVGGLMSGISKLKSAVKKGMAISPLTFIAEWFAHDSAIVNVQTFVYQEPDAEVFVPDKEKQKGLTFDSLVSKNKTANNKGRSGGGGGGGVNTTTATGEISDSDEDEDERQHRMMRAEIQRNMTEATTEHHYYNSNGNSGHSSGINSPHNPHISGSNSPTCASTNNGQQQSKKRSEPHGHRLMNSANKNTILKHYNGNSLVYNDDITTLVPDIDGFLVTSGKDQVVYLWSLVGELVGRVGGASWNISDMKTWGRGKYISPENKCLQIYNSKTMEYEKNAATLKSGMLRGGYYDSDGNFHRLYISRYDKHGNCNPIYQKGLSQFLNSQVEEMVKASRAKRQESRSVAQNQLFNKVSAAHPFVAIPTGPGVSGTGAGIGLSKTTVGGASRSADHYYQSTAGTSATSPAPRRSILRTSMTQQMQELQQQSTVRFRPGQQQNGNSNTSYVPPQSASSNNGGNGAYDINNDLLNGTAAGDKLSQMLSAKMAASTMQFSGATGGPGQAVVGAVHSNGISGPNGIAASLKLHIPGASGVGGAAASIYGTVSPMSAAAGSHQQ